MFWTWFIFTESASKQPLHTLPDACRTQQQAAADGELSPACRLATAANNAGGTNYQQLAAPGAGLSFCRAHSPLSKKDFLL
jgi:hypothetical protein